MSLIVCSQIEKRSSRDPGRGHDIQSDTMLPGKIAIEALRLMEDGRYRYLPIVDDGKAVGTVSRFDFGGFELDRLDEETRLWEGAHLTAEAWMRPTKNVSVRRRRGSGRG